MNHQTWAMLSGRERFKAVETFEVTEVPDGFVVFDAPNEKVHYLNPTAAFIFTVCDGTLTVDEIRDLLRNAYEIDALLDLDPFFDQLEQAGLVCEITAS